MPAIFAYTRRIKFWLHLTQAYIRRYQLRITAAFVFLLIFIFFLTKIWSTISRVNIIPIGYVGSYTVANIPTGILNIVTQPLITADENGRPKPALASHWTVSEDGKTYIVFLKDNLTWHDLTAVNAANISLAISDVKITALNNKAIEFKLTSPITSFPQALDKPVFKAETFYGTGEYRIVKLDQTEGIVKRMILHPKDSKLPKVEIKFYQDQLQAANALKIGEIKYAKIASAASFENWPNLNVEKETDFGQTVTIFFNNQDPLLSSKDLRQALIFAVNRSEFDGELAFGPISPSSWASNQGIKKYSYNTGKAKELLSKLPAKDLAITLSISPGLEDIGNQIKSDWQAIGISVNLKSVDATPEEFQALLAVNQLSPDPDQYALWHSTQNKTNITKYRNVKVDKLLEDARSINDEEERKDLYFEFQETLVEDAPAAFLYHPYRYKAVYKNIKPLLDKLPTLD